MADWKELIKKLFGRAAGDSPKRPVLQKLNVLIIIASVGILMIVLANTFSTGGNSDETVRMDPPEEQVVKMPSANPSSDITKLENTLAQKLEEVLTQIEGVGDVEVTINLASTTEKNFAVNTSTNSKNTREFDQKGGNRTITEIDETGQMVLVRESQGNREQPIVVKEIKPEVRGVIVVAEGAEDPVIRSDLMKAVHVYLDLPLYKVIVLSRESR